MAGGTLEDADLTSINMAELVEDSSKIEIYQVEAEIADNGDNTTGEQVNLQVLLPTVQVRSILIRQIRRNL